jgi:uncharacterized membrane protein
MGEGFAMDPLAVAIAAAVLVLVFVRGLWHKLAEHGLFRVTLAEYGIVPERMVPAAALAIIIAEMVVVAGLLLPSTRAAAAVGAAILLACYAAAIGINLRRGRVTIDCGCGGPGQGLSWLLVARNMGLISAAALAAMPVAERGLGAADAGVFAFAVVTVWLLIAGLEQAASNSAYVWLHRHRGY